jgi:hypothetical protein
MPPVAAVYVKATVLAVEPAVTLAVGVVSVPEPFGAGTIAVCVEETVWPVPFAFDAVTCTLIVEPESVEARA